MNKSLGSISALAALCASPAVDAAVMVSPTISNSTVVAMGRDTSNRFSVNFDINNDAQIDFSISSLENSADLILNSMNGTEFYTSGLGHARSFSLGETIDFGLTSTTASTSLHSSAVPGASLIVAGTSYFGLAFNDGSGFMKNAWVELDIVINSGVYDEFNDSVIATTAQWETTDNTSITVVPEPSSFVLSLVGLSSLVLVRRR